MIGGGDGNIGGEKHSGDAAGDLTVAEICDKREGRVWDRKGVLICLAMA